MDATTPPGATYQKDKAYTLADAASALTISKKTLTRHVEAGLIRSIKVSERRRAVPGSEIIRILANGVTA